MNFYIDEEQIERAALGLLVDQAKLLAGTPVDEVRSILLKFFRFNLHLFEQGPSRPEPTPNQLAGALLAYVHEIRQDKLYLIPARRLALARDHIGPRLVLSRPTDPMLSAMTTLTFELPRLNGRQFPPFAGDTPEGQFADTDCWIGCVASSDEQAYGLLEAVLGAVSLILPPRRSRVFSMADRIPYIYCMGGQWQARLDGPTFPPLIDAQQLGDGDITALQSLFEGTRGRESQQRIELGLQFAGAGWSRPGRIGFLHNAIAFDALFGEKRRVRESIQTEVVRLAAGIPRINERIRRLINIRNALLHGKIHAVETSSEYLAYHQDFGVDPYEDQVTILSACVRALQSESSGPPASA